MLHYIINTIILDGSYHVSFHIICCCDVAMWWESVYLDIPPPPIIRKTYFFGKHEYQNMLILIGHPWKTQPMGYFTFLSPFLRSTLYYLYPTNVICPVLP